MKFLKRFIALALVLASVLSICATAQAAYSTMYVNCPVGETVRLRASASTSGTVLVNIPRGTAVQAEYYNATWHKVTYGSYSGYMMSSYLSTTNPDASGTASGTRYIDSPNGNPVNVRTGPGTSYSKTSFGTFAVGTKVTLSKYDTDSNGTAWYYVTNANNTSQSGWVRNDFLSITDPTVSGSSDTWQKRYGTVDFKETSTWREGVSNFQHDLNYYFNHIATTKPNNWETLAEDGYFGYKSSYATLVFQQQNNLTADGIAGPNTKAALFDLVPHDD